MDIARLHRWREVYAALDPFRVLSTDEIGTLYAERPDPVWEHIAESIAGAANPATKKVVLAGPRGSGKTTELTRVAAALSPYYAVVRLDVAATHPDDAGTQALVALVAIAVGAAVRAWQAPDGATAGPERLAPLRRRSAPSGCLRPSSKRPWRAPRTSLAWLRHRKRRPSLSPSMRRQPWPGSRRGALATSRRSPAPT